MTAKEPLTAVILSLMLPGWGHAYAGRPRRGLAFLCAVLLAAIVAMAYLFHPSTPLRLPYVIIVGLPLVIGLEAFLLHDAFRCAKVWNARHGSPALTLGKQTVLVVGSMALLLVLNPVEHASRYVAQYLVQNVVQAFEVAQYSMEPALQPGDRVLVARNAYKRSAPRRGDIVVFRYPRDPDRTYLKRIVGLPGETVEIRNERILINGAPLQAPGRWATLPCSGGDYPAAGQAVTVPAGHYFVIGDNCAHSEDSRAFGSVPREHLVGKAYKIYYPFERSGALD